MHPGTPAFSRGIQIVHPASTPCAEGIEKCYRDQVCYQSFQQHCAFCTDHASDVCACLDFDGPLDEGAACWWNMSADVEMHGTCDSGGICTN